MDFPPSDEPTPQGTGGEGHHHRHIGEGEGTAAVLRALMTMLGEVLQSLDRRMAAVETAVAVHEEGHSAAPSADHLSQGNLQLPQLEERLQQSMEANHVTASALQATVDRLEDVARAVDTIGYGLASLADSIHQGSLEELRRDVSTLASTVGELVPRTEATEQQVTALLAAVRSMDASLAEHAEETANSLGHKASKAGRRLASDLGLFSRAKRPPSDAEGSGPGN